MVGAERAICPGVWENFKTVGTLSMLLIMVLVASAPPHPKGDPHTSSNSHYNNQSGPLDIWHYLLAHFQVDSHTACVSPSLEIRTHRKVSPLPIFRNYDLYSRRRAALLAI